MVTRLLVVLFQTTTTCRSHRQVVRPISTYPQIRKLVD